MDRSELERLKGFRKAGRRTVAGRPAISGADGVERAKAHISARLDSSAEALPLRRVKLSKDHARPVIKAPKGQRKPG